MQSFVAIFCLFAGVALTVGTLMLLIRRALRQLAVAGAYREVALLLGLEIDTRGVSIRGHLADRRVWVGELLEVDGAERTRSTEGIVAYERPLGLGLHIRRRGRPDRMRRKRSHQLSSGDTELDKRIQISADEPKVARGLFTPEVRAALNTLLHRWPDASIDDLEVRVRLAHPESNPVDLHRLVQSLLEVASALEAARGALPPPTAVAIIAEDWKELSERLDLSFDPSLPALHGLARTGRVLIAPRREPTGMKASLTVRFRDLPPTGLSVLPRKKAPHVGQDIPVGDASFRQSFVVKGFDPASIQTRLGLEARVALLALAERGTVTVDDHALTVTGLPLEAQELHKTVPLALHVADALAG